MYGMRRQHRLVLYEDGTKIDYTVWPVALLRRILNEPGLPDVLDVGYRILVDKDHLAHELKPPTYTAHIPAKPTENEGKKRYDPFFVSPSSFDSKAAPYETMSNAPATSMNMPLWMMPKALRMIITVKTRYMTVNSPVKNCSVPFFAFRIAFSPFLLGNCGQSRFPRSVLATVSSQLHHSRVQFPIIEDGTNISPCHHRRELHTHRMVTTLYPKRLERLIRPIRPADGVYNATGVQMLPPYIEWESVP